MRRLQHRIGLPHAAIAEALLVRLFLEIPKRKLRPASLVFDVKYTDDGVLVRYLDKDQKIHTIQAQAVVMSCPKFIAEHLIDDLEPERREVIKSIRYRSYLVANVCLRQRLEDNFYDLYFFRGNRENLNQVTKAAQKQKISDAVYGNFAKPQSDKTILTVFRGFPYDGARPKLLAPEAYENYRKEFEQQIFEEILPPLGVKKENVADVRLARWGHPLPVCEVGNIKNRRIDLLRKPFKDRVFFIEQDNWTLPAFETTFYEAHTFTPQIEELLNRG